METKKVWIPIVIAVLTLLALICSATYAYFLIGTDYESYTTSIGAEAEGLGSVALKAGSNLNLNLSAVDMMLQDSDVVYYATEDGTPSNAENTVAIATAEVTGNGTFTCSFTLNVEYSGNMKEAIPSTGTAILNVDGVDYDIYSTTFPKSISGTLNNVSENTSQTIDASLKVINLNGTDQSDMAGTSMALTFIAEEFSCHAGCSEGYYFTNNVCKSCASKNCETCDSNTGVCFSCITGYYLSGTSCAKCSNSIVACAECSGEKACTKCNSGYYLENETKCRHCSIKANCVTCDTEANKCIKCKIGYYPDGTECVPCSTNGCNACNSTTGECVS